MFKLISLFLFVLFAVNYCAGLECYTGYAVVRGQTVGTNTKVCTGARDQCYKAKADVTTLNKLKLAGCSTFRCMLSSNKCQTQNVAGQSLELCCCNDKDLCNGPEPNSIQSTVNQVKDSIFGSALKSFG